MSRWPRAALLLACGASVAAIRGDSLPALRIGVLKFSSAESAASGAAASDLFSASLVRNFPGIAVVERARLEAVIPEKQLGTEREAAAVLQRTLGLDSLVSGSVIALEKDPEGGGGTLMMSARLVNLSAGELLWTDTLTVRVLAPLLRAKEPDAVVTGKLLELAAFKLVQDLGKRLPEGSLAARRRTDTEPEGCSPPSFYEALPRDHDWYYGAGKDADTDKAREAALLNLAKQATGFMGESPPGNGPLAGWEQDDFRRCEGVSYVLVRIEKQRFTPARGPKEGLRQRLDRLDAENDLRLERLQKSSPSEKTLQALQVDDTIASLKTMLSSDIVPDQVAEASVAGAEELSADAAIETKARGRSAESPEEQEALSRIRRRLEAGTIVYIDFDRLRSICGRHSDRKKEMDFIDALISRRHPPQGRPTIDYDRVREYVFPIAWNAAMEDKDWARLFKYCAEYLRSYPNGFYIEVAEKNRANAAKVLMLQDVSEL